MSDAVTINPHWGPSVVTTPPKRAAQIEAFHRSIPGFAATPLIALPDLAADLGARALHVKYEAERLGLPSFKIVGASWAVACAVSERLGVDVPAGFRDIVALASRLPSGTTFTTATDGNHGRAVAHLARRLGRPSRIFVPMDMAAARIKAIESEQAEVVVINGSYDDAVAHSAAESERDPRHILVSDTSWPGYETIPATVVEGYNTIFREIGTQLTDGHIDVAFVPAGVGAFASSAVYALHSRGCEVVTVEPVDADCVRRSISAGEPVAVPGPHRSIMAGLNCGEVSRIAWPVLRAGVHTAVAVTDDEVKVATRALAVRGLPSGESGASALAGAVRLARHRPAASRGRTVLLLDTEGVTDPG